MLASRNRVVSTQLGWMMATILILVVFSSFSYELFFVVSFIGLLVTTQLALPDAVAPKWQRRFYILIALGCLGLVYIAIQEILRYLPEGVF
ncbi:hypothetical protein [Salinigranum halophilum]|uniref:hypothetical protein n=1 Tax=Salinigranum halophilum TaxID=2565931 RepID=UPI0010A87063|nr:hypothetical protein [Salinigranum halophilum]